MGLARDKLSTLTDDTARATTEPDAQCLSLLNHCSFSHLDLSGFDQIEQIKVVNCVYDFI